MTHAALINAALFCFLVLLTLLLVTFIGAVIVAPAPPPNSPPPLTVEPLAPPPAQPPAPPAPLPRRRPLATATAAGTTRWSADTDAATDAPIPVYNRIGRPKVSGEPPWGPAPKPPGMDG